MRIETRLGGLRVETTGEGPPAVLWHSLFVDSSSWDRIVTELAGRRRLVLVDGPGHGRSEPPPNRFTLEDCASAAIEILDDIGVTEPVDWVGNAWGGHVGIVLAARNPERVRSLVAMSTPINAIAGTERLKVRVLVGIHRVAGARGPVVKGALDVLLSEKTRSADPEAVALVTQSLRNADRDGLQTVMASVMLGRPDITDYVHKLDVPTLFITGADDTMWTPADVADLAARVDGARWAAIEGAAHLPPLEVPGETSKAILDFWSG